MYVSTLPICSKILGKKRHIFLLYYDENCKNNVTIHDLGKDGWILKIRNLRKIVRDLRKKTSHISAILRRKL